EDMTKVNVTCGYNWRAWAFQEWACAHGRYADQFLMPKQLVAKICMPDIIVSQMNSLCQKGLLMPNIVFYYCLAEGLSKNRWIQYIWGMLSCFAIFLFYICQDRAWIIFLFYICQDRAWIVLPFYSILKSFTLNYNIF
ncbi:hypothetical protein ACJX0J_025477, partial [Zea mays]